MLGAASKSAAAGALSPSPEQRPGSEWIGPQGPSTAFLGADAPIGMPSAALLPLAVMAAAAAVILWALRSRGHLRSDSLAPRSQRAQGLTPVGWLAGGLALWLAWQFGGTFAAQTLAPPRPGQPAQSLARSAAAMWPAYAIALAAAGLTFAALRTRLIPAGFRARPLDPLLGLALLAAVYPFVFVVGDLSVRAAAALARAGLTEPPDGPAHDTLRMLVSEARFTPEWWAITAMVVVAAPILEEIIHRGFIQTAFIRATGKPWLGIVLASAIFSVIHLGATPLYVLPGLFVLSVGLGWAFERTGRIAVPIAMHAGFNALNILAATLAT